MKYLYLLLFSVILSFAQSLTPQKNPTSQKTSIDLQIQDAKILASSNPEEATKKLLQLKKESEKTGYKDGAMKSSMGLLLLYYNGGDYKKTIEESHFVEKYAKELQYNEYISDVYRIRSNAYGETGLFKECLPELDKAVPYADKIESENRRYYRKALIYESYAGVYEKMGDTQKQILYRHKSISESNKIPGKDQGSLNAKYQNLAYQYGGIALVYQSMKVNDSANYYFEKALEIQESEKYDIYDNARATLLSDMAKFYSENGMYRKSISFAKKAENIEKHVSLPYIRKDIYKTLFNSYVETKTQDSSKYYLKLYTSLNDSILKSEKETILTPVKQIISDKEAENKAVTKTIIIISVITLVIMAIINWAYWKRKNKIFHNKYKELITKLSHKEENISSNEDTKNKETKPVPVITDDISKSLLQKLEKFEKSEKYLRKDISVGWLAHHLDTNVKYLSESIKIHRNNNFADYINGLKIKYIINKLYENPLYRKYKISYLSEECGYATPRVFLNAFKKETGITPSYFIKELQNEKTS